MNPLIPILLLSLTACTKQPPPPASPSAPATTTQPASKDQDPSATTSKPGSPGLHFEGAGEASEQQTEAVPSPSSPNQTPIPLPPDNLLQNPSFENKTPDPWYNFADRSPTWRPFNISTTTAYQGKNSAHLNLNSNTDPSPTSIHGIVQTVETVQTIQSPALPTYISGHYQVQSWTRSATHQTDYDQYLQLVIMAQKPTNKPPNTNYPTYQLAIPLAGITEPPFTIANRKFAFTDTNLPEPKVTTNPNDWTFFQYNLPELFQEHWNFIPDSTSYRIFFEVRYDNRDSETNSTPSTATVHFDALYLGPTNRVATP